MTTCLSCGGALPEEAVSTALQAARCPTCGALNDLAEGRALPRRREVTPLLPAPSRWEVERAPGRVEVRWRWLGLQTVFLVPFTLFWDGMLLTVASTVVAAGHWEKLLWGLVIPHVWVGVGLLYFLAASFLNRTRVVVDQRALEVRLGPVPWRGNRRFEPGALVQLFVLERRGRRVTWELCGVRRDGGREQVVAGFRDGQEARFLECTLERALGIEDRPVPGEMAR